MKTWSKVRLKKNTKATLVNFAQGSFYEKNRSLNTLTGRYIGGFDKVYEYSIADIDKKFQRENSEILNISKGAGLWLWKPYFLVKTLDEINYGEYLFHCDSSSVFIRNISGLIKSMDLEQTDFMLFALPFLEKQWTHPLVLSALGSSDSDRGSNQMTASFFVIRKTEASVTFLQEWLALCMDINLLQGPTQNQVNDEFFLGHRYDQSLLSLLAKKNNIQPFRDPSQYGEFPWLYRNNGKLNDAKFKESTYKTSILLLRKNSAFREILKYAIRKILRK